MLSDGDFQYIPYLFISMLANLDRYKIVLASNSPRRKELMTGLGVDYVVKTLPDVDESYPDTLQGEEIPLFIAREKAAAYQSMIGPEELLTDVRFAILDEDEIAYYVDHYQPMDKAGSYGVQEWIGFVGVESISGSYFNVMGLPIQKLYRELKQL